ncbi:hypothetical protein D3C83_11780 [compost metagenome]
MAFQLGRRQELVDQAHVEGFLSAELASREKYLGGEGRAHKTGEPLDAVEAVAEAELGRGHSEAGGIGRETDVAADGNGGATPDAVAMDHRDGGFRAFAQRAARSVRGIVVELHRLLARALLLELRDVGAGAERLLAGASQHDDADLRIAHVGVEHHWQ